MYLYFIALMALVQGVTEFLPISSSGHLVLLHSLDTHRDASEIWKEELAIDIALHVGTLLSALLYFRKDIFMMFSGFFTGIYRRESNSGMKISLCVVFGSIPVVITGLIISFYEPEWLRTAPVIGWSSIIFGILLWYADKFSQNTKKVEEITYRDSFVIGLSQCLSLIQGVSRSGITMTAGRFLGYARTESARFSLLLSIIAISGAGTLQSIKLYGDDANINMTEISLALVLSFLFGYAAIFLMMKWLAKASFTPFVIYRVGLGVLILAMFYAGYDFN